MSVKEARRTTLSASRREAGVISGRRAVLVTESRRRGSHGDTH